MWVLGLTGGSGTGKGYVSALFARRGIPSLDCDVVSRQVCVKGSPCLAEIAQVLGDQVLTEDGEYDRAATARIVFSDREKLNTLNRITHRYILAACREWLDGQRSTGMSYAIIDAPVLYESGFDAECDAVIAVIAEEEERIRRIMKRDGISEEMAGLRLSKQRPIDFYRERADYLIENNAATTKRELEEQIDRILASLSSKEEAQA